MSAVMASCLTSPKPLQNKNLNYLFAKNKRGDMKKKNNVPYTPSRRAFSPPPHQVI
jgi:hypothetical protein